MYEAAEGADVADVVPDGDVLVRGVVRGGGVDHRTPGGVLLSGLPDAPVGRSRLAWRSTNAARCSEPGGLLDAGRVRGHAGLPDQLLQLIDEPALPLVNVRVEGVERHGPYEGERVIFVLLRPRVHQGEYGATSIQRFWQR